MAIEFNCPYCTAAIRVPDAYSGKRGSCPKCATKLLVPDVVPGGNKSQQAPPASSSSMEVPAPEPARGVTQPAAGTNESSAPESAPTPSASPVIGGLPVADFAPSEIPVFAAPPTKNTAVSKRLKKKTHRRKSQLLYSVGIPVICFLLFFGVIALVMTTQQPELKGTLRGTRAGSMLIPTRLFPVADLELDSDQRTRVESAFEADRESFVSSQMTCRIGLDAGNLTIDVSVGDGFFWFAVNPANDIVLSDWIRKNQTNLNADRLKRTIKTGTELCQDKLLKASGEPVVFEAEKYRDGFGLNTNVKAFGYVVEAIAGQRKSVCAYEDTNGTLYFALPADTKSFLLKGRLVGGISLFEGEYTVEVAGDQAVPLPAEDEPAPDAMEPDAMAEPMEPESTDEPEDGAMNSSGVMSNE